MNTNETLLTIASELTGLPADRIIIDGKVVNAVKTMHDSAKDCAARLFVDRYVCQSAMDSLQAGCKELGIEMVTGDYAAFLPKPGFFGAIVQYPNSEGSVEEYASFVKSLHAKDIKVSVITDMMPLVMLLPPAQWGADIAIADGIDKMASFIAQNGTDNLEETAARIHGMASYLNDALEVYGYGQENTSFFNTLKISLPEDVSIKHFRLVAEDCCMDFHYYDDGHVGITIDEETDEETLSDIIEVLAVAADNFPTAVEEEAWSQIGTLDESLLRNDSFLKRFRK